MSLLVGTADYDIELPIGMAMTGYIGRDSGSTGIHDQLKIKAIIFNDGITRLALIVCDLLGLDNHFVRETASRIEVQLSIPQEHVVIACTHNHAGPASILLQNCGEVSESWLVGLRARIVKCIELALKQCKPVQLEYATGTCVIGFNRVLRIHGESEIDPQVGVLKIRNVLSGDVDTILVNYACHPVSLGWTTLYGRDYPHYLELALQEQYGPKTNVIYTNGCAGDVNPEERGGFPSAEKLGSELAAAVSGIDKLSLSSSDFENGVIKVQAIPLTIPLRHHLNKSKLYELMRSYEAEMLRYEHDRYQKTKYQAFLNWVHRMLQQIADGTLPREIQVDLRLITIGHLVILTLPFEVFHDIGLKVKRHFGEDNTLILGYANGLYGYVPSKRLYAQADYEAGDSSKFYGYPGPLAAEAEGMILQAFMCHGDSCAPDETVRDSVIGSHIQG